MPRILFIDDEDKFRESLARRLKLRGFETVTLNSGADAVKIVRANDDIDVVILDRKMPDLSGEEVLKEIKKFRPEIQVIMLTGHGTLESAIEGLEAGATDYLVKPVYIDDLIKKAEEAFEKRLRVEEKIRMARGNK